MEIKRTEKEAKELKTYRKPKVEAILINNDIITTSGEGGCCILKSTPVIMGDFSTKKVEDLRNGDQILAFNFFTGKFESTPLLYTFEQSGNADKFDITLENGTKITILNDEDMFDVNKREFFTICKETYKDAIGKLVLVNDNGNKGFSKIVDIKFEKCECSFFTLYSKKHLNYVANNIVLLYAKSGFSQKYTITENLTVDMNVYNEDVEKYGLFEYKDVPEITKEMFDDFDYPTCKFLIGKGIITKEEFDGYTQAFIKEYTTKRPIFLNK